MSVFGCAEVRDLAPDLAFGILDGEIRAEALLHVDRCNACRTRVAELSETADTLVFLAPEAEPPAGFERRAVDAMVDSARRRRWRTVKLVAITAAAAAILSVVVVRVVDEARSPSAPVAAPTAETVSMVGADGLAVGRVDVVRDGSTASLFVTVDYALSDGDYRVVLDRQGSAKQGLGTVQVVGGRGSWSGTADLTGGPTELVLVDATGRTRCSADLPVS